VNASEMIDQVYVRTNTVTGDPQFPRPVFLAWLNEALRRYQAAAAHWPWLDTTATVTLTAGQATVPNAGIVREVTGRDPSDGRTWLLHQVTYAELVNRQLDVASEAPSLYSIDGNTLFLWPRPQEAGIELVVRRTQIEPVLTDSAGSQPLLPVELRDLLVDHAVRNRFLATGNLAEASAYAAIDTPGPLSNLYRAAARRRGRPRVRTRW
jgi:hypothetical protein